MISIRTLKQGILYLLNRPSIHNGNSSYTFLEIREFLRKNNIVSYFEVEEDSWMRLKALLRDMAREGVIEERHIYNDDEDTVVYSIEPLGVDIINNELSMVASRWKLPDF